MIAATSALSHRLRPVIAAVLLGAASALASAPACARGPDGIADVAEKVIDAVVNISTSQTIEAKGGEGEGEAPAAAEGKEGEAPAAEGGGEGGEAAPAKSGH